MLRPGGLRALLSTPISRSLWVGILGSFVLRLAGSAIGILLAKYLNERVARASGQDHIDPGIVALLTAIFYLTELTMSPVMGALSDRWGRKPFLMLGPILGAVAVQIYPFTTVILVLAICRLIEGLSTSCNIPATLGFLSDATGGSQALRGRVMGLFEVSSLGGLVLGPALGGLLWDGLRLPLLGVQLPGLAENGIRVTSLIYLLVVVLIFFFIDETSPGLVRRPAPPTAEAELGGLAVVAAGGQSPVWTQQVLGARGGGALQAVGAELRARLRDYRELLRLPRMVNFIPAWLTITAVLGLWFTHIAALLTRHSRNPLQLLEGGYSAGQVAELFIVFGVTFTVGILFWSLLYARIRRTTLMLSAVVGTLGVVIFAYLYNNQALPNPPGQWPLAIPLVLCLFVMSGFTPVALAYLADISEEKAEDRGMVMGFYSILLGLGQLIGAGIGVPFIRWFGFNGLLLGTALLALIGLGVIYHLRRVTGD